VVVAIVDDADDVDEVVDARIFACSVDSGGCAINCLWNIYGIYTRRRWLMRQMPIRGKSGSDAERSQRMRIRRRLGLCSCGTATPQTVY